MENKNNEKKVKPSTMIAGTLIFVAFATVVLAILVYFTDMDNGIVGFAKSTIPFPAVVIDGSKIISMKEINENSKSVKKFYETQDFGSVGVRIDFSTEDGKKRLKIKEKEITNKMIEDRVIEILARERGIVVTDKMVEESVSRKLSETGGGGNAEENLKKLYGWTMKDFENKVVTPGIYKTELEKNVLDNDLRGKNDQAKLKMDGILKDLNSGKNFYDVAKDSSEGESAKKNGKMGWFRKDQLVESLANKIFKLEKGQISDIIESELGFHIVKVEDKKTEEEKEMIEISQIFVSKETFGEWLEEKMKDLRIVVLMKGYYWNKDELRVDFKNENLKNFEKKIISVN